MQHAKGTFEVKMGQAEAPEIAKAAGLGNMTIDKTWHGALEGTSRGEMVHGGEPSTGAMVYVALERITAKLDGRDGSFLVSHVATMMQKDPASGVMNITIVPHSGTGALQGIAGSLKIIIDSKGGHSYELDYTLPAA